MDSDSKWAIAKLGLYALAFVGLIWSTNSFITNLWNMPKPPKPLTDVWITNVTNLSSQSWWFQNHYLITVNHSYTFETDLATYSNFNIGDSIKLGREFIRESWQVVNVTRISGT